MKLGSLFVMLARRLVVNLLGGCGPTGNSRRFDDSLITCN